MSEISYPARTRSAEPDKVITVKGKGAAVHPAVAPAAGAGEKTPKKIVRDSTS